MDENTIPLNGKESTIRKLCKCGCGQVTNIVPCNFPKKGLKKGEHYHYIRNHQPPYVVTPETRAKMVESHIGNTHTELSKLKMSLVKKGLPHTPEHTKKVADAQRGTKRSAEVNKKFCEYQRNRPESHNVNIGRGLKGRVWSEAEFINHHESVPRGESHHGWKGGITPVVMKIRTSPEYRKWRTAIFERDNYTCAFCGKRGIKLEVDHFPKLFSVIFYENKIATFAQGIACKEFWDINNGRTLCRGCHDTTKTGRNPVGRALSMA